MVLAFSSTVHLHSKKNCISIDAFVPCCHTVFSFIAITVPVDQRDTRIKLGDHQFLYRLHWFFLGCCDIEKKNDNCRELTDLEGNMLMLVLRKLFKRFRVHAMVT